METILSQLPSYIKKYPPSDQVILNDFLSSLQLYLVDTQADRNQLNTRFKELILKYHKNQEYYDLPFLWFAESYLSNSSRLLSLASFHADDFYRYLVNHLRGYSSTKGVFQLIAEGTSLSDLAWEQLQYTCMKLSIPLTSEELHVLETVLTLCNEDGINALNFAHIKSTVMNRFKSIRISKKLPQLFSKLNAFWSLHFFPPAFDLELLYVHFQLRESSSLKEIIDFQNPANTTLDYSFIYKIRDFPNMYYGILVIPTQFLESLLDYLQYCERQGQLILHEVTKIITSRRSISLALYQSYKGWRNITLTDWRRLVPLLTTKHPRKRRVKSKPLFLSPPFKDYWNYKQHSDLYKIITLYCKIPHFFSFNELPIGLSTNKKTVQLSKLEITLLKDFYHNQVFQISFSPFQLIIEFSLDRYWIKIPKIPLDQLSRLLGFLPSCLLYITETNIHMETVLTPELAQKIRNDLEWTVMPIILDHPPQKPVLNWYDPELQRWKPPLVLKSII